MAATPPRKFRIIAESDGTLVVFYLNNITDQFPLKKGDKVEFSHEHVQQTLFIPNPKRKEPS